MKSALAMALFKVEATYGVNPTPTAANDWVEVMDLNVNPVEMELDDVTPLSNTFGKDPSIVGSTWASLEFSIKLCGSGTRGTPPLHGRMLRACGRAETIVANTSVTYSLVSTGEESGTMLYYNDGVLWTITGIRGGWSESWTAKKGPTATFKGLGLAAPMTDAAMPTPVMPTQGRKLAMNEANTQLVLAGTYAARCSSFSFDDGNSIEVRDLTGRRDIIIGNRDFKGSMTIELPKVAEYDLLGPNGICTQGTPVTLSVVHGTTAGNIITSTLNKVQLLKPKPQRSGSTLMLDCELVTSRTNGNDELVRIYT